jgi:hypothetical protein
MRPDRTEPDAVAPAAPGDTIALASVSAGIVAFQIVLMQVLASVVWYHFAYLIISFALLGFGLSGTLLSIRGKIKIDTGSRFVPLLTSISATGMMVIIAMLSVDSLTIDLYSVFSDPSVLIGCTLFQVVLLVPFTAGALVIALLLLGRPARAGKTYAINLSSSAAGALIGPVLLEILPPGRAVAACALLPAIGTLATFTRSTPVVKRASVSLLAIGSLLALIPPSLHPSPFKDISRLLALPEARIEAATPAASGFVQVISSPSLRLSAPLSLEYHEPSPQVRVACVNGDAAGSIVDPGANSLDVYLHTPEGILPRLLRPGPVWILEPESTLLSDSLTQVSGSPVTLITRHPVIGDLLSGSNQAVSLATEGPRTYLRRAPHDAALIRLPSPMSPSGSVGLGALSEQPLFTTEAFAESWTRLAEGGILSVTVPIDHPARATPRLLKTLLAGLKQAGVTDPSSTVIGVRTWSSVTFLARHGGFTSEDTALVRDFCARTRFDLMAASSLGIDPVGPFNTFVDSSGLNWIQAILDQDPEPPHQGSFFNTDPPTDNRPYFSQFIRLDRITEFLQSNDFRDLAYLELGLPIVLATLISVAIPALILIVVPLLVRKHRPMMDGRFSATLVCSASLGFGFIATEIGLIQRTVSLTGNPVVSTASIMAVLLLTAGAGSLFAQKFPKAVPSPFRPAAIVAAWLAIAVAGPMTAGPSLWYSYPNNNYFLFLISTAAAGFFMGMPFPKLIAILGRDDRRLLPWAWAINGFLSVVGAPVAAMVSVIAGFPILFLVAAGAYALAATSGMFLTRTRRRPRQGPLSDRSLS